MGEIGMMKRGSDSRKWVLAALGFGAIAVAIALRGTSIWSDEGLTYSVIRQDFSHFSRSLIDFSAGSAQCGMLLYIWMEWLWVHVFGTSELAMRAANVVFMIPYMAYAAKSLKKLNLSPWYLGLFACHSMFIFQINNVRPYVLLASMGMAFFYYAMLCDLNDRRVLAKLHLFFLLGMMTHMMFLFAFVAYLARCVVLWRRGRLDVPLQFKMLAAWLLAYALLAAYYVYVFTHAGEVDNALADPVMCIAEILYFLAGFYGLGLNRIHLRDFMFDQLAPHHVVLLGLMVAAYAGMLVYTCKGALKKRVADLEDVPGLGGLLAIFLMTLIAFFAGNIAARTLFWDRHCIWILSFALVIQCPLLDGMLRSDRKALRAFAVLMIVMQLVSTGFEMFDPYHSKDDYKGVVRWIDEARKEDEPSTLLFMGAEDVYEYYGWVGANTDGSATQPSEAIGRSAVINCCSYQGIEKNMEAYPGVYYLVLSRLSRYDPDHVYDRYEGDTQFQSFKIVRVDTR